MGFYMGTKGSIHMEHTTMNIPEPIRDKVEKMVLDKGNIEVIGAKTETIEIITESISKKSTEKKRKIRICKLVGACPFKNVWTHVDRCYASFSVWNTCLHRGMERKI